VQGRLVKVMRERLLPRLEDAGREDIA